jgi:hypothetical protein
VLSFLCKWPGNIHLCTRRFAHLPKREQGVRHRAARLVTYALSRRSTQAAAAVSLFSTPSSSTNNKSKSLKKKKKNVIL